MPVRTNPVTRMLATNRLNSPDASTFSVFSVPSYAAFRAGSLSPAVVHASASAVLSR